MISSPLPSSEQEVWERLIILLRILCLFRGCDLAHSHRNVKTDSVPWFLRSQRKGRLHFAWYPVPKLQPLHCDPQYFLALYLQITASVAGPSLFYSLPRAGSRSPLKSDTINSITTKYLHARGLVEWTAHSTRGAAATALLARGIPPRWFKPLGIGTPQSVSTVFITG